MKKIKKGFTLVELLVVIAIIAILAAIIAPNAFKAIEKSKVATAEADYKAIKTAALGYYTDTGKWPGTQSTGVDPGLAVATLAGVDGFNGPYLEKWPSKNPWGGNYAYEVLGATSAAFATGNKVIKLDKVPLEAAKRLDLDLDGKAGPTEGSVRYITGEPQTVYILISEQ